MKNTPVQAEPHYVIQFKEEVEYQGPGGHCLTFKYGQPGQGYLNLAYADVAAVFKDGEPLWKNRDMQTHHLEDEGLELILAPHLDFIGAKKKTFRFKGDDYKILIIRNQVNLAFVNGAVVDSGIELKDPGYWG